MRGLGDFQAAMARLRIETEAAAEEIVTAGSMILVAKAQQNFQGSHGRGAGHVGGAMPNIVSGDLRRSIRADSPAHIAPGVVSTIVAPHMAYGRRVELGLGGADGAGRVFSQPPHPYFSPAVSSAIPDIAARAREIAAMHMRVA